MKYPPFSGSTRRRTLAFCVGAFLVAVAGAGCASCPAYTEQPLISEAARSDQTYELLRLAADHEALFTLAGGLKPMSTGIWRGSFAIDQPDLTDLRSVRAALEPLRNDLWYADVQVFHGVHEGERAVHAFIVHRCATARMIERFEEFWSPWGITPCTHPAEVLALVDRMPKADRWRGYGYLFGYPADAVDFFVEAGLAAEDGREVGPEIDRSFIHLPTFAEATGRFTYAVPLDHLVTPGDEAMATTAARILSAYAQRREYLRDVRSLMVELRRLNDRFESEAMTAAEVRDRRHNQEGVADAVLHAR